jgi:peptidoglycan/LPS O-acetylase OafA/YrhL
VTHDSRDFTESRWRYHAPSHQESQPRSTEIHLTHIATTDSRIKELDGLRGLAAASVLVGHYLGEVPHRIPGLALAWVGVDLFFVISGFLIGMIILKNRDSTNFFGVFYLRRAARILPIYILTVCVTLSFINALPRTAWNEAALNPLYYATFTQNFGIALTSQTGSTWLLPTWTLAVEEQFYLLSPFVICTLPRRYTLPVIVTSILVGVFARALFFFADHELAADVLLVSRSDSLAIGLVAAYATLYWRPISENVLRYTALGATLILLLLTLQNDFIYRVTNHFLVSIVAAAYVILAARRSGILKSLRAEGLQFLGAISYGLYLLHQPISGVLHGLLSGSIPDIGTRLQVAVTLLAILTSVGCAWISWKYLEEPLLRKARLLSYKVPGINPPIQPGGHGARLSAGAE